MEARFGNIVFTSKFDSGNLARVEKVEKDEFDPDKAPLLSAVDNVELEFNVWTKPDCAGTQYENGNRSWFYFGVRGGSPNRVIKINIMNLNRQGKLYSQGHAPLVRTMPTKPKWERIRERPTFEASDGQFQLSFSHRFVDGSKGATVYFAFCFPWSYTECQDQLCKLDNEYEHCALQRPDNCKPDDIYYHHEVVCHSLDNLCVDLLTISDCHGMSIENEPCFDKKLFPNKNRPRCKSFRSKRVYMVTSRVHPGETPASFVFNGFLEFILRPNDPRAQVLRRNFVFKLIPILNPDGVQRGHYRTDSRGVNLNRMYQDPDFSVYPSIYASKSLLIYHHIQNKKQPKKGEGEEVNSNVKSQSTPKHNQVGLGKEANSICRTTRSDIGRPSMAMSCPPGDRTYNMTYEGRSSNHVLVQDVQNDDEAKNAVTAFSPLPLNVNTMCTDLSALQLEAGAESAPCLTSVKESGSENTTYSASRVQSYSADNSMFGYTNMCQREDESINLDMERCDSLTQSGEPDAGNPYIGNEGSDDDDMDCCSRERDGSINHILTPHLCDPALREVDAAHSGIAFYIDLHGHASKRGCFIYGNYFENEDIQVENMLFPRLIAFNTAHFDFTACNFTERNMYMKDKREGLSKEGSGRVSIHKAIGITHSYTLECNYNSGRLVNSLPPAYGDDGRATPPPLAGFPPKYTQQHFEEVGRAMAVAALDMLEINPWSRLVLCEYNSLPGVREWVRRYIRGLRGQPRAVSNRSSLTLVKGSRVTTTSPWKGPKRIMTSFVITVSDWTPFNELFLSKRRADVPCNYSSLEILGIVRICMLWRVRLINKEF